MTLAEVSSTIQWMNHLIYNGTHSDSFLRVLAEERNNYSAMERSKLDNLSTLDQYTHKLNLAKYLRGAARQMLDKGDADVRYHKKRLKKVEDRN